MYAGKEHGKAAGNKVSRLVESGVRQAIRMKDNRAVFQKVDIANNTIHCPSFGNAFALGNTIHSLIETDYLRWGHAGPGNRRIVEFPVPAGHIPDIGVINNLGNITRYGEIKPEGNEAAGRAQINAVAQDAANNLTLGNQVNVLGWAQQVAIPINTIDPLGSTQTNVNRICLRQDRQKNGLYVYYGA